MATTLQGLQGMDSLKTEWRSKEGAFLFGVRHLSAAGAWHVKRFLDRIQPEVVLIESPADTSELIDDITKKGVKPPVAILCYTTEVPVHSLAYPLAVYSPEYQGVVWAHQHKKSCRFIDLPSGIKAPLYRCQEQEKVRLHAAAQEKEAEESSEIPEMLTNRLAYYRFHKDLYQEIAHLGGESDYDIYWERQFEHNLATDVYLHSVALHSGQMRTLVQGWETDADPLAAAINALREAYMKRCILETIRQGVAPAKIVVITGAYHILGLLDNEPMTDEELASLPKVETKMTLMPYSYYKLSTFSGYGAGNHAPYYYEMMWRAMERGELSSLPSHYLTELSRRMRKKHGYSSTASVIEAVRLAQALQYLHGATLPTLKDLHDSAVATLGDGQAANVADFFVALDVGVRIGALPEGVSQTPIQDDMNRQLKKLRLEKYKTVVAQDLALDLRENRRVKSREAAFLDLDRSVFLHRLALLDIPFAKKNRTRQESASWAEQWVLCWTPEAEIQIVESVLFGDTVEVAAAYILRDRLKDSKDVLAVANLVRATCECRLRDSVHDALSKLQELASETENFSGVVRAAREMSFLTQYGGIRRYDPEPLTPILQQLFLKGALLLCSSASCNDDAAKEIAKDMATMHYISQEHDDTVNDEIWLSQLKRLAKADDKNPLLCGFAFSILLERGFVGDEDLATEISRHLSPGNTPEAGAIWFEGLSRRNRYVLLSKTVLWQQLDEYLLELADEEFKRALVCLRRAFAQFEPLEKNGVCDLLAELWQVDAGSAGELLQEELTESEKQALADLSEFDFDF